MKPQKADIDKVVKKLKQTKHYKHVCEETLARIATKELEKYKDIKLAVKESKEVLWKNYGAFRYKDYKNMLDKLKASKNLKDTIKGILLGHESTKEHAQIVDEFYKKVFKITGTPKSVLDLGAGLTPLTIPWMNLPKGAKYRAYDIDIEELAFLNEFFKLLKIDGQADTADLLCKVPKDKADLALLLKVLPPLEWQEKGSIKRVLENINAPTIIVTIPIKFLGLKGTTMPKSFEETLQKICENKNWPFQRIEFETEITYIIKKK